MIRPRGCKANNANEVAAWLPLHLRWNRVKRAATHEADEEKQSELTTGYLADTVEKGIVAAAKPGTAEHLAGRLAERQVRDALLAKMPKRGELIAAASPSILISGTSTYPEELARFQGMLVAQDLHGIIARYPVRHSGILKAIAKALKFQSCSDYEAAAITRISSDKKLREALLMSLLLYRP